MNKQNIKNTRLELTWIGKDIRPNLEPRILLENPQFSYHASHRVTKNDIFDNKLIHGDNLLALKAIERDFFGKVKCIYIDPPFNTGAAFDNYDDGIEHSLWLSLMKQRLDILKSLLKPEGCIFVHLDDNEIDYLKIVMDEVFGRNNFLNRITVEARSPSAFSTVNPGVFKSSEYILWYAKDKSLFQEKRVRIKRTVDKAYNQYLINPNEQFSNWKFTTLRSAFEKYNDNKKQDIDKFVIENAKRIFRFTAISETGAGQETIKVKRLSEKNPGQIFVVIREGYEPQYLLKGQQLAFYEKNVVVIDGERTASSPLTNVWTDIAWEGIANEGGVIFKKGKKPERLIRRCLELATDPGDIVLDSFAGSGTTGAVAHKMNRRWIMIEHGEQAFSHIAERLRNVIDGNDSSGVTKVIDWKGGGGFRYYTLAPSLMEKDSWGRWIINKEYNPAMLTEAICKLEGFTYSPSDEIYWQHGFSTEQDFIYVTTATLSGEQLSQLSEEVGEGRTLLVLCPAFRSKGSFTNLTIKKIPKQILSKCEWAHDDYSLQIDILQQAPNENIQAHLFDDVN